MRGIDGARRLNGEEAAAVAVEPRLLHRAARDEQIVAGVEGQLPEGRRQYTFTLVDEEQLVPRAIAVEEGLRSGGYCQADDHVVVEQERCAPIDRVATAFHPSG